MSAIPTTAIAIADFDATEHGDLPLAEGQEVTIMGQIDESWLQGEADGMTGIFPRNFVEFVFDAGDDAVLLQHNHSQAPRAPQAENSVPAALRAEDADAEAAKLLDDLIFEKQFEALSELTTQPERAWDQFRLSPLHLAVIEADISANPSFVLTVLDHPQFAPEERNYPDVAGRAPLALAVCLGNTNVVDLLLQHKCDPNYIDDYGRSAAYWAVVCFQSQSLRALLSHGTSLSICDTNGYTLIHTCAGTLENLDCLQQLLEATVRTSPELLGSQGNNGETSLSLAVYHEATDNINMLLEYAQKVKNVDMFKQDAELRSPIHWTANNQSTGPTEALLKHLIAAKTTNVVNLLDGEGFTALQLCIAAGNKQVIGALARYTEPSICDANGRTPLHWASVSGDIEIVSTLLEHDHPATRAPDVEGCSPLHYAMRQNRHECVRLLIERDPACATLPDATGLSPLSLAAYQICYEAVNIFIELCPKYVDAADENGMTPLFFALTPAPPDTDSQEVLQTAAEEAYFIVRALLRAGANPNTTNSAGQNPISYGYGEGSSRVTQVMPDFLDAGLDLNHADPDGKQVVHHATIANDTSVLELVVQAGADTLIMDSRGETAVHYAAYYGNSECLSILLRYCKDPQDLDTLVNAADDDDVTPLHWAALSGAIDCVKELLERGANPSVADCEGLTPLDNAAGEGHVEVSNLIRRASTHIVKEDRQHPADKISGRGHFEQESKLTTDRQESVPVVPNNDESGGDDGEIQQTENVKKEKSVFQPPSRVSSTAVESFKDTSMSNLDTKNDSPNTNMQEEVHSHQNETVGIDMDVISDKTEIIQAEESDASSSKKPQADSISEVEPKEKQIESKSNLPRPPPLVSSKKTDKPRLKSPPKLRSPSASTSSLTPIRRSNPSSPTKLEETIKAPNTKSSPAKTKKSPRKRPIAHSHNQAAKQDNTPSDDRRVGAKIITTYMKKHKGGVSDMARRQRIKKVIAAAVVIQRYTRVWLKRRRLRQTLQSKLRIHGEIPPNNVDTPKLPGDSTTNPNKQSNKGGPPKSNRNMKSSGTAKDEAAQVIQRNWRRHSKSLGGNTSESDDESNFGADTSHSRVLSHRAQSAKSSKSKSKLRSANGGRAKSAGLSRRRSDLVGDDEKRRMSLAWSTFEGAKVAMVEARISRVARSKSRPLFDRLYRPDPLAVSIGRNDSRPPKLTKSGYSSSMDRIKIKTIRSEEREQPPTALEALPTARSRPQSGRKYSNSRQRHTQRMPDIVKR